MAETKPTEICAKCGYTYEGHIGNTGCLYPCWTPSGRFADTPGTPPLAPEPSPERPTPTFTIWAAMCPFRRNGSPVLGNMGSTVRQVVVMDLAEWDRLCAEIPQLATTNFRVGTFE